MLNKLRHKQCTQSLRTLCGITSGMSLKVENFQHVVIHKIRGDDSFK